MRTATAAGSPSSSDAEVRARILARWEALGLRSAHCGGVGLVVGCPVCGRTFGR